MESVGGGKMTLLFLQSRKRPPIRLREIDIYKDKCVFPIFVSIRCIWFGFLDSLL